MRILFFSSVYPHPKAPTCGTYNRELCRALSERHAVRVVAARCWWDELRAGRRAKGPPHADSTGVRLAESRGTGQSTDPAVDHVPYFVPPKLLRRHYGWFMRVSVQRRLVRVLQQFAPDCVLSYWVHPDGEVGLWAARRAGVPAVVIAGGSDVLILTRTAARRRRVLKVLCESQAVVTVSEGLRQRVLALGVPPERVHTIYQGIDASVFHPGPRRDARRQLRLSDHYRVLIWVGRMVPVKGLDVLIDAFSVAAEGCGSLHLYLLGDGPLMSVLRRSVEERRLTDRVHFVGSVAHHDLPTWYRAADGTVLSSWSEGLPNVLRESLACGTPFVATDVGSVSEIAAPAHSLLTPAGDVILLADAMRRITEPRYRRGAASYRARTWADTARDFSELLAALSPVWNGRTETVDARSIDDRAARADESGSLIAAATAAGGRNV